MTEGTWKRQSANPTGNLAKADDDVNTPVLSIDDTITRIALIRGGISMKLGVIEHIDCAHSLPGHPRCGALHGHTYKIELMIEGKNEGGMIVDFSDLRAALRETLALYDHKSLNDFLAYPSVENICEMLQRRLKEKLSYSFSLRVWEGEGKWAEI
jgi:6-pyruvoyltetrahydropterin/6-carboxytetrahydropterin synthase